MHQNIKYYNSLLIASSIILLISFITFANILPNKLFFDDEELIYKNAYVQNLNYFPNYFLENMVAGAGKISNMYRPILTTSFAFDYAVWKNNPFGFHLTSILLHAVNGILVFYLILKLFKNKFIAFLTALFFIIHPVQSEPIAYASGRTDPLFTMFGLASIILFLEFIKERTGYIGIYLLSFGFFIFSLLSKEQAVILPFLIFLTYHIFFKEKKDLLRTSLFLIPFMIADGFYVLLRLTVLNFSNTLNFYTTQNIYSQSIPVRFYTFCKVFFDYMALLFFPKELNIARSPEIITGINNPYVLLFIIFIAICLISLYFLRRKNILYAFVFFWFFISILPVSGIIPINNIEGEHYLYLPSIGFFLLISYVFWFTLSKISSSALRLAVIIIIVLYFSVLTGRTVARTFDWRDPITFYTISLKQSPWHIPMRNNLAMAYAESNQIDRAVREYQLIISQSDVYPNVHHNLANAYKDLGRYKEAEEEYYKALNLDPNFYFSYFGLADLYLKTGDKTKLDSVVLKLKQLKKL